MTTLIMTDEVMRRSRTRELCKEIMATLDDTSIPAEDRDLLARLIRGQLTDAANTRWYRERGQLHGPSYYGAE